MSLIDATTAAFRLLLSGDAVLWQVIWVSLKTTAVALVLATPLAVVLGYAIASHRFRGRRIAIWLVQAALSLPTVLIGLLLYLLLSRHGPWGGLHWLFSQPGIIAGQFVAAGRCTARAAGEQGRPRQPAVWTVFAAEPAGHR